MFWDAKQSNNAEGFKIWAYFPDKIVAPDPQHPIVQSYVDTILRGCLNVGGEEFAKDFIQETKGWHPEEIIRGHESLKYDQGRRKGPVWIDDRDDPVYIRGDPTYSSQNAERFDELLEENLPERFQERKPIQSSE